MLPGMDFWGKAPPSQEYFSRFFAQLVKDFFHFFSKYALKQWEEDQFLAQLSFLFQVFGLVLLQPNFTDIED